MSATVTLKFENGRCRIALTDAPFDRPFSTMDLGAWTAEPIEGSLTQSDNETMNNSQYDDQYRGSLWADIVMYPNQEGRDGPHRPTWNGFSVHLPRQLWMGGWCNDVMLWRISCYGVPIDACNVAINASSAAHDSANFFFFFLAEKSYVLPSQFVGPQKMLTDHFRNDNIHSRVIFHFSRWCMQGNTTLLRSNLPLQVYCRTAVGVCLKI